MPVVTLPLVRTLSCHALISQKPATSYPACGTPVLIPVYLLSGV